MRAEFYADQARRYGTYMRNFGVNKVFKIACGPSDDNYQWTETMMKEAGGFINGLSLHYYSFSNQKTAADFDEAGWFDILKSTLKMEEFITKHSAIMDKYDHSKRIALVVDEWGTWYAVEPGTNPGFLFQQNTMRDAVAAACNLNIFNNHCDRVRMANIAQMVNVLQAMILTSDDKMILTPTYYVFDMYKVHQNALVVKTIIESPDYILGNQKLPAVSSSASIDDQGKLHITLCNIDPKSSQQVLCSLNKFNATFVTGRILTAKEMNAHNSFSNPDVVSLKIFSGAKLNARHVELNLPPMSVVALELEGYTELPPAIDLKEAKSGVTCKYYEGRWSFIPTFDSLKAKRTEIAGQFIIPENNSGENFAVQYSGFIKILKDGSYTFFANSDDGAAVSIDGGLVVDNDGQHAPQEESGTIVLKAGFHPITVGFFQAGGGKVLDVSIEGPGMQKQIITKEMLYHE